MKKKIFMILIIMLIIVCVPSVYATNIAGCKTLLGNVAIDVKIANTVHKIIVAIKIAVPVLLVIFGMIDLFKGIMAQKEDEIKKGQQTFIKRIIAAAIIFFIIQVVQFLISFVTDNSESDIWKCASCFINGADVDSGEC